MLTLGLAGGLDPVGEQVINSPSNYAYDGAAVLVEDGVVVVGAEEARLNRIKHSDKFPFEAIRFCLEERGISAAEIDGIGYYVEEDAANALLSRFRASRPGVLEGLDARRLFARTVSAALGAEVDPERLHFYQHRLAHAASAVGQSGFDDCLVYVVDSAGGILLGGHDAEGRIELAELAVIAPADSLNTLCERVLPLMGFGLFDEHKAMALAAHGDPDRYEPFFARLCELRPEGTYALHLEHVSMLAEHVPSRRQYDPPMEAHADLAAALQRCMEWIALHVLEHHRGATGKTRLCLAGGMIENSALGGRILNSRLFNEVFVHPAAYDAGCAIGAALLAASARGGRACARLDHMYWGTELGSDDDVLAELECWRGFLTFERTADVAAEVAARIADGEVVGWVQGRAEFGSHALGNRTVLADPRRTDAVERVGRALNRGEAYRPLAAAALEEDVADLFELTGPADAFALLTFSVPVRDGTRSALPASTQVDGTARIQAVSHAANLRFWQLIAAFKQLTGVPALASTSFNSDHEPTVDSARDAVVSFLTTGLDRLVIGDPGPPSLAPAAPLASPVRTGPPGRLGRAAHNVRAPRPP
jgi:carbamoyltransferase